MVFYLGRMAMAGCVFPVFNWRDIALVGLYESDGVVSSVRLGLLVRDMGFAFLAVS